MIRMRNNTNKRVLIFAIWIVVASALVFVFGLPHTGKKAPQHRTADPNIQAVVHQLLRQYRVDPKTMATRTHSAGNGNVVRIERRVKVAPDFNTLNFHVDLSRALAEHDATVTASEKSEDGSVAMHIKKDGMIVETLVFLPRTSR